VGDFEGEAARLVAGRFKHLLGDEKKKRITREEHRNVASWKNAGLGYQPHWGGRPFRARRVKREGLTKERELIRDRNNLPKTKTWPGGKKKGGKAVLLSRGGGEPSVGRNFFVFGRGRKRASHLHGKSRVRERERSHPVYGRRGRF